MCVIMACDTAKPTLKLLQDAEWQNRDGAGMAWLDGKGVRWEKGLKAEAVYKILLTVKLPVLIHFRMATIGGKSDGLTHPFPIEPNVRLDLKGVSRGVMVHNGHWEGWKKECLEAAASGRQLPPGEWSDSRGLAWLASIHGDATLGRLQSQRIAVLRPKEGITMWGEGWSKRKGVWYSNLYFIRPIWTKPTTTVHQVWNGAPFGYQEELSQIQGLEEGWAKNRIRAKYFGFPTDDPED